MKTLWMLLLVSALGCEQQEGDRCQVQRDCADGLICNRATGLCQSTTGGVDALFEPDAPVISIDAATFDAAIDASTVDASTIDAAL